MAANTLNSFVAIRASIQVVREQQTAPPPGPGALADTASDLVQRALRSR